MISLKKYVCYFPSVLSLFAEMMKNPVCLSGCKVNVPRISVTHSLVDPRGEGGKDARAYVTSDQRGTTWACG